jgi:hypothetical protein
MVAGSFFHAKPLSLISVIPPVMIPPIAVMPTRMDVIDVTGRTPIITRWVVTVTVRVVSRTVIIARSIVDGTRNSDADVNPRLRLVCR